jgi:hypothetical protein
MVEHKGQFLTGLGMIAAFTVVLILIFSPVFKGKNGLDYLDNLYNSISKGSAYYVPKVRAEIEPFAGSDIKAKVEMGSGSAAERAALLFKAAGARTRVAGSNVTVEGGLGKILQNALSDADVMYHNKGEKISAKYGLDARLALFTQWKALKGMEADLKNQKKFKEAKAVDLLLTKAVETAYNYYGIAPERIGNRWGVVLFSLVFYVIYTMWYGFAIMFMFEGWGLKLEH